MVAASESWAATFPKDVLVRSIVALVYIDFGVLSRLNCLTQESLRDVQRSVSSLTSIFLLRFCCLRVLTITDCCRCLYLS